MASRHLQRLRAAQGEGDGLEKLQPEEEEFDSGEEESAPNPFNLLNKRAAAGAESGEEEDERPAAAPFNPFDLLSDEEGGGGDDSADDAAEGADSAIQLGRSQQPPSKKPGAKKKKKKKGGKAKGKAGAGTAASPEEPASRDPELDSETEQLMESFAAMRASGAAGDQQASTSGGTAAPLLAIDARALRPDDELRRIFGSQVVDAEGRDGNEGAEGVGATRRVRRLMARGLIRRVPLKRGILIKPRDTWPRFDGGISMEPAGIAADGTQIFRYVHSTTYQFVQKTFEAVQRTFDPNNIAALLAEHPYHVEALIVMADLYRATNDVAYAEEALERALYALEMAWHPRFQPGVSRLEYRVSENKSLFVVLFRYMQSLSRRGLHATALEVCKLLLGLDPDDPWGALLYIDYLALRAQKHDFLERMVKEYGSAESSLLMLPNFIFSIALSCFERSRAAGAAGAAAAARRRGAAGKANGAAAKATGTAAGDLDVDTNAMARRAADYMLDAVMQHPLAVVKLIDRLREGGVAREPAWSQVLSRPLFATASDVGSGTLGHLTDIFVERHAGLWRGPEPLGLLLDACQRATAGENEALAADFAAARAQMYPPGPNNYRHLRLADYNDTIAALPPEELQAAFGGGGFAQAPRPGAGGGGGGGAGGGAAGPAGELNLDPQLLQALEDPEMLRNMVDQVVAQGNEGMNEEELRGANPLFMLLRSLLPWVQAGEAPDYAAPDDADAGGGGTGGAVGQGGGAAAGPADAAGDPADGPNNAEGAD